MDVLSDVLRVIRLSGAVFFTADLATPWCVRSEESTQLARVLIPTAECLIFFHIVTEGTCWIELGDREPVALDAGDVVVFPRGDTHVMRSEGSVAPVSLAKVLPPPPYTDPLRLELGGDGPHVHLVCGYLHCERRFLPLFGALPPMLVVRRRGEDEGRGSAPSSVWLKTTVRYLTSEATSRHPGNGAMLTRLTELMFVEVLRRHMEELPDDQTGWLAALRDPQVGTALERIHDDPARPWEVEELARTAGMSRSSFAERFAELVGQSPIRYVTEWRMQIARRLLAGERMSVAEVAGQVGYESEYAFNRAFKREVGEPPAAWRRRVTAAAFPPHAIT